MPHVSIARDPCARFDTIRETVPQLDRVPCAWCGQPGRFRYGTHADDYNARPSWDARTFCSVSCRRVYYS